MQKKRKAKRVASRRRKYDWRTKEGKMHRLFISAVLLRSAMKQQYDDLLARIDEMIKRMP